MTDRIGDSYKIAKMLWDSGYSGPDGATVLAMALGIYMESQEGSHRNMRPVVDAMLKSAQITFDAFQANKNRSSGSA